MDKSDLLTGPALAESDVLALAGTSDNVKVGLTDAELHSGFLPIPYETGTIQPVQKLIPRTEPDPRSFTFNPEYQEY